MIYCCDNCFFEYLASEPIELPDEAFLVHRMDLQRSLKFTYTSEYAEIHYYDLYKKHLSTMSSKRTALPRNEVLSVKEALKAWRSTEYDLWVRSLYPTLLPCNLLSNDNITKLSDGIMNINTSADLSATLISSSIDLKDSILDCATLSLLSCISAIRVRIPVHTTQASGEP